ncbi:MAG: 50S ribosome-binding GTPase [Gemmatimonadetes bacterium]|nr:50S ribosome-binding GTPase [Gemmatimonadota bacterium]
MSKNKSSDDSRFEPDFEAYGKAFDKSFERESEKFEEIKKQKLIMALYGSVNSGKSSTINALTGQPLASVKAVAGWNKEVMLYPFGKDVYISDTPGLEDIDEENSARATEFVEKDADIILFLFNAGVGASKSTVDAYEELQRLDKPIIVVLNKIDMLHINEQEEMEKDIKEKTGARVVPISARDNRGVDVLHRNILEILEFQGKDLLYLKVSKFKDEQVDRWITGATISAAGIAAIPIPGADIFPLTALQAGLAMKIAFIYECEVTKKDVMQLVAATVTGSVGRQIFRLGIQGLKAAGLLGGPLVGAAMAIAAGVAASVTYGFGHACKAYYKSGMTLELDGVVEIFRNMSKQYKI